MSPRERFDKWISGEWAEVYGEPTGTERERLYWVFLGGRSSAYTQIAEERLAEVLK